MQGYIQLARVCNKHYTVDLTSATTPSSLTDLGCVVKNSSTSQPSTGVFITVETDNVRYTTDGVTDPNATATVGHLLYAGQNLYLIGWDAVDNFRVCNATAGALAKLQIAVDFNFGGQI